MNAFRSRRETRQWTVVASLLIAMILVAGPTYGVYGVFFTPLLKEFHLTRAQVSSDGTLRPLVLDPRAEALLRDGTGRGARALSRLTDDLAARARDVTITDDPPVLVVAPDLRRAMAGIAARHVPGLAVMSYREVDPTVPFVTRGVISAQEAA